MFLFSETTNQGLENIPLVKIMKPILFIEESLSLQDSAKTIIENEVSSLVVGSSIELKGIFTKTDLVKHYEDNKLDQNKVVDYMTHDYVSTHTATPLFKVVRKMLKRKVSRVIIKDQNENPVGVISFRDLFRISIELGNEEDNSRSFILDKIRKGFLSEEGFGNISLARDVMTKGLITIKFNQNLSDACKLILENNVSGLVVLDGNELIAGTISKTDITRAIAK